MLDNRALWCTPHNYTGEKKKEQLQTPQCLMHLDVQVSSYE